jgi:hypothetical protein
MPGSPPHGGDAAEVYDEVAMHVLAVLRVPVQIGRTPHGDRIVVGTADIGLAEGGEAVGVGPADRRVAIDGDCRCAVPLALAYDGDFGAEPNRLIATT